MPKLGVKSRFDQELCGIQHTDEEGLHVTATTVHLTDYL